MIIYPEKDRIKIAADATYGINKNKGQNPQMGSIRECIND